MIATVLAFVASAAPAQADGTKGPAATHVIIVANNDAYDGSRSSLAYADDDGVRYAELFELSTGSVRLLTVLDDDTQRMFPARVASVTPPRRDALLAALDDVFAAIRTDVEAGRDAAFYFIYSGHGDIRDDGEGFVHLTDGPFTRSDLFEKVIGASPATVNHVIIDACNAYYLVNSRGAQARGAGDYGDLIRSFVAKRSLQAHPNTGVVLSTAAAAEVHEWGRLQAGIFSHQLRSALAGAADANADGAIDYHEVSAFIAAANGAVTDPKARIDAFARAPAQNRLAPLAAIPRGGTPVRIPNAWTGHVFFEDDRGIRFADLNKTDRFAPTLHLVPRPRYFLRSDDGEILIEPADEPVVIELASLERRPIDRVARGAAQDQFERLLFSVPFGPSFVAGFSQADLARPREPMSVQVRATAPESGLLRPVAVGTGVTAAGLAVAAGVLEILARSSASEYRTRAGSDSEIASLRSRAEDRRTMARTLGILAAGLAAVSAGVWVYDETMMR